MLKILLIGITFYVYTAQCAGIFLNNIGYCEQEVIVKQQKPVLKTRPHKPMEMDMNNDVSMEQYVEFEEKQSWQTVHICCPGYHSALFGICRPVCKQTCPLNSYCAEPNKCLCRHGYEPMHQHWTDHYELNCHPTCIGGCPKHSHCVGHNRCACRAGYKDVSHFFAPLRCERLRTTLHKKK